MGCLNNAVMLHTWFFSGLFTFCWYSIGAVAAYPLRTQNSVLPFVFWITGHLKQNNNFPNKVLLENLKKVKLKRKLQSTKINLFSEHSCQLQIVMTGSVFGLLGYWFLSSAWSPLIDLLRQSSVGRRLSRFSRWSLTIMCIMWPCLTRGVGWCQPFESCLLQFSSPLVPIGTVPCFLFQRPVQVLLLLCRIKLVHTFFVEQWETDKHKAQWICKSLHQQFCCFFPSSCSKWSFQTQPHSAWGKMRVENVINEVGWAEMQGPTALWILGRDWEPTALGNVYLENSLQVPWFGYRQVGKLGIFKKDTLSFRE